LSAQHEATNGSPAKSSHHSGNTWFLALTALGVVYGDIGTSTL
jgi:KUP system potassium uptake protein